MLDGRRVALLDIDGTLCRGEQAIPGAPQFVDRLRAGGIQPVFFTNNATRTPAEVVSYLSRCSIHAAASEVRTSAQFAAHVIAQRVRANAVVAYIGQSGLALALRDEGLRPIGPLAGRDAVKTRMSGQDVAESAVMGLDPMATYATLAWFCQEVVQLGWFMLTNSDARFPGGDGFMPGNGALGSFVTTATGIQPIVAGKPSPDFVRYALQGWGAKLHEAVVVGDNAATDIAAGVAAGVATIQVKTGVWASGDERQADFIVDSVADL